MKRKESWTLFCLLEKRGGNGHEGRRLVGAFWNSGPCTEPHRHEWGRDSEKLNYSVQPSGERAPDQASRCG